MLSLASFCLVLTAGFAADSADAQQPSQPEPERRRPVPLLTPDADGYCQRTEFVGWSSDGSEAAYSVSYCREPPPDVAYDTLLVVDRKGVPKRWFVGEESGATNPVQARAEKLGGFQRNESTRSPDRSLTAVPVVKDNRLLVTLVRAEGPGEVIEELSAPAVLPYSGWKVVSPPKADAVYWSPDGGALAVEVRAVKRKPTGGTLPVATVVFVSR